MSGERSCDGTNSSPWRPQWSLLISLSKGGVGSSLKEVSRR